MVENWAGLRDGRKEGVVGDEKKEGRVEE